MGLFFFSEILLFVLCCQGDNLLAEFLQLTGFLGQLVEKGEGFLLSVDGMDNLNRLVVVVSNAAELLIESG